MVLSRRLGQGASDPGGGAHPRRRDSVESNARLTGSTAAVLLLLLAAEGATIPNIRGLLSPHVFIGMVLIPPVVLKTGSTFYRFIRYYTGEPGYRQKGPPPIGLRVLGPVVVVLTVTVLATGVALLLAGPSWRSTLLFLHKVSFVLWFGAMTIHVISHLAATARLAPRDYLRRTRREVAGAGLRQWAVITSVVIGVILGFLLLGRVGPWLATAHHVAR